MLDETEKSQKIDDVCIITQVSRDVAALALHEFDYSVQDAVNDILNNNCEIVTVKDRKAIKAAAITSTKPIISSSDFFDGEFDFVNDNNNKKHNIDKTFDDSPFTNKSRHRRGAREGGCDSFFDGKDNDKRGGKSSRGRNGFNRGSRGTGSTTGVYRNETCSNSSNFTRKKPSTLYNNNNNTNSRYTDNHINGSEESQNQWKFDNYDQWNNNNNNNNNNGNQNQVIHLFDDEIEFINPRVKRHQVDSNRGPTSNTTNNDAEYRELMTETIKKAIGIPRQHHQATATVAPPRNTKPVPLFDDYERGQMSIGATTKSYSRGIGDCSSSGNVAHFELGAVEGSAASASASTSSSHNVVALENALKQQLKIGSQSNYYSTTKYNNSDAASSNIIYANSTYTATSSNVALSTAPSASTANSSMFYNSNSANLSKDPIATLLQQNPAYLDDMSKLLISLLNENPHKLLNTLSELQFNQQTSCIAKELQLVLMSLLSSKNSPGNAPFSLPPLENNRFINNIIASSGNNNNESGAGLQNNLLSLQLQQPGSNLIHSNQYNVNNAFMPIAEQFSYPMTHPYEAHPTSDQLYQPTQYLRTQAHNPASINGINAYNPVNIQHHHQGAQQPARNHQQAKMFHLQQPGEYFMGSSAAAQQPPPPPPPPASQGAHQQGATIFSGFMNSPNNHNVVNQQQFQQGYLNNFRNSFSDYHRIINDTTSMNPQGNVNMNWVAGGNKPNNM